MMNKLYAIWMIIKSNNWLVSTTSKDDSIVYTNMSSDQIELTQLSIEEILEAGGKNIGEGRISAITK